MTVRSSQIRCQFFTYLGLDFIPESTMFKGEQGLTVHNQSRIFNMLHKIRFSTWSPSWRYTVGEQNTSRAEMERANSDQFHCLPLSSDMSTMKREGGSEWCKACAKCAKTRNVCKMFRLGVEVGVGGRMFRPGGCDPPPQPAIHDCCPSAAGSKTKQCNFGSQQYAGRFYWWPEKV